MRRLLAIAAALVASIATVPLVSNGAARSRPHPNRAAQIKNRYALVHGCYFVRTGGRQLGPFRMQAAALGQYLLYGVKGDFLGPSLTQVSDPSVWSVNGRRKHYTMTNTSGGRAIPVSFVRASGCAVYPEAQVGATGRPARGPGPAAAVRGTMEGHAHVTAFEFFGGDWHCGKPFDAFGAPYALPADCSPYQQGTNGQFEAFLDFGGPSRPSDMHGWPTFKEWPSPTALAEEGDYWTAIERAWKAGLRLLVTNLVDNEALCSVMTKRHLPCNDMASVHTQSHDLYALQDYIDAQSGGPGKGWFRVVTDPFQARRVINAGKLAVVEGIEVSRLFGCGEVQGKPQCNQAQVDAGLNEVRGLGVRTFFPVHEFDNAFGGTKGISGESGVIVNAGNRDETGSFWTMQPCSPQDADAEQLSEPPTGALAQLFNGPFSSLLGGNPAPVYGPGPQCNTRGLTSLGDYLIRQMAKQHLIVQLDHMSTKTARGAIAVAESVHYPGLVSAHCCGSYQLNPRVYRLGGYVNPQKDQPSAFNTVYETDKSEHNPSYYFGFGYGSDMNGLSAQPGPLSGAAIHYPFKSYDGRVTFTREVWGQRSFDLNTDGVANYGMYADWLQALQQDSGRALASDMFRGAEAYLEMWERAYGVRKVACVRSRAGVRRRASFKSVLYKLGQPSARSGRVYTYRVCGSRRRLRIVFSRRGSVVRVTRA